MVGSEEMIMFEAKLNMIMNVIEALRVTMEAVLKQMRSCIQHFMVAKD